MIRVLHIFHEMANGGIEHFVMDYYRHMDRSKIQFDFLVSVDKKGYFDDEILELGGKIFHAYPMKRNPIKNYQSIAKIVKENGYDIIHRHTGSAFGYFDLKAAKSGGAKQLILHSHNNQAGNTILHYLSKIFFKVDCEKLACSQEAGEWLFGKTASFKVINNAIDCNKFQFKEAIRREVRHDLNISDKFVVGHVGRFEDQKNHEFLIDIFQQICLKEPQSVLVCVGTGSLQDKMEEKIKRLGLTKKVIILGNVNNVESVLQAVDAFVLPSHFEGFGISLLEAQACGLRCYASADVVPESVNVCGLVEYISLNFSASYWAERILEYKKTSRQDYSAIIAENRYDITESAHQLEQYYEKLAKE